MRKTPTAEEFSENFELETRKGILLHDNVYEFAVQFAKLHVEEFRKEILKKTTTRKKKIHVPNSGGGYYTEIVVDKKSIRNAYPLINIK